MEKTISVTELRNRLARSGHRLWHAGNGTTTDTDVWPRPETIVTVGLNLDPTLKEEYRQRYFACLLESPENPVPVLQYDEEYALPTLFQEAADGEPALERFMDGPFRWLLRRLLRFSQLLLWPSIWRDSKRLRFAQEGLLEALPRLRLWLQATRAAPAETGAVILDLSQETDCRVLWEVANHVSQSEDYVNFFVSDPGCTEVYEFDHHEKVQVSIPDEATRQELLEDLADWADVLEDCSGYGSDTDEGDE